VILVVTVEIPALVAFVSCSNRNTLAFVGMVTVEVTVDIECV